MGESYKNTSNFQSLENIINDKNIKIINIYEIFKLLINLILNLEEENIILKEFKSQEIFYLKRKQQRINYEIKFYCSFSTITFNNKLETIFRYGKIIQTYLNNRKKFNNKK